MNRAATSVLVLATLLTACGTAPSARGALAARRPNVLFVAVADGHEAEAIVARELYDHEADPLETENVVDRPAHAAVSSELAARLRAGWRAEQAGARESHRGRP